jgi:hypothetical protein
MDADGHGLGIKQEQTEKTETFTRITQIYTNFWSGIKLGKQEGRNLSTEAGRNFPERFGPQIAQRDAVLRFRLGGNEAVVHGLESVCIDQA